MTCWQFKSRELQAVHEGQSALIMVFDRIMTDPGWDNDAIAQSIALNQKLHDFKFVFFLEGLLNIFHHIEVFISSCTGQEP